MDQFEDDLKQALRRVDPPEGFERRLFARLSAAVPPPPARPREHRVAAWAVAAGLIFASFGGVTVYRQYQQQRRALDARDQLLLALRVTGQKLDNVRNHINRPDRNRSEIEAR